MITETSSPAKQIETEQLESNQYRAFRPFLKCVSPCGKCSHHESGLGWAVAKLNSLKSAPPTPNAFLRTPPPSPTHLNSSAMDDGQVKCSPPDSLLRYEQPLYLGLSLADQGTTVKGKDQTSQLDDMLNSMIPPR